MINGKMGTLDIGDNLPVRVVGVVNLSPASFYKDSITLSETDVEKRIIEMIKEGADCLDIGAQSTRPIQIYGGEGRVDRIKEQEIISSTLKICMDVLSSYDKIEVSVDTQRENVAEISLNMGVNIINDIAGFKKENNVAKLIADYGATAVIMAAREEPGDIFEISDIILELNRSLEIGLKCGIAENKLIVDPGIGSWEARDFKHDYNIIKNLEEFRSMNKPVYVGISRKTFIGKAINDAPPDQRLYGSLGATIIAIVNGAHVVRTHDVRPTLEAIKVAETILNYKE